ncbi:hypothetical protein C4D60_Mb06t08450 [Musa balbisiana]|uniref:Uncharacterized protein n=1 Tax=Musa balbisiana TaxID=52838 RepID=A0A4S8ILP9_MUSBA|nr:hypothetical protein C4D60_Mb06t08450 [Musa balbisiana]
MAQPAGRPMVAEAAARRAECAAAAAAGVRADGGGDLADGAALVLRHEVLWPQEARGAAPAYLQSLPQGRVVGIISLKEEKDKSCLQQYAIAFDEKALHQFR